MSVSTVQTLNAIPAHDALMEDFSEHVQQRHMLAQKSDLHH
jgi:hypothetical protein